MQSEETKHAEEFQITVINILKSPMEEIDKVQGEMDNLSRERKILRKSQNEMFKSTLCQK